MGKVQVVKENGVVVYVMPARVSASDIVELRDAIHRDINNIPPGTTYKAIVNTNVKVVTASQATTILNEYSVIGNLRGIGFKIAILIHGDPQVLAKDAGVNWKEGGFWNRAASIFETIMAVADNVSAYADVKENPIMNNPNVDIIYGQDQAIAWLNNN